MLCRALNLRTTVAVVGGACSQPLGYPGWQNFCGEVLDRTVASLQELGEGKEPRGILQRLREYKQLIEAHSRAAPEDLMFYLGACKSALHEQPWQEHPYHRYLRERFGLSARLYEPAENPHRALVGLPINRFVTTNYDCELERALSEGRGIPMNRFGIDQGSDRAPDRLSFTQENEDCDRLAEFALARLRGEPLVFHCHGRFDRPESVIATERDYQQWYLSGPRGLGTTFKHVIELLFRSNPLLFVGYGLGDEDLLRPLRILGSVDRKRQNVRPVFALLPESEPGADWHHHEFLYERYCLHVIPYVASRNATPEERGRTLCCELARLEEVRKAWFEGWLGKPMIRKVVVPVRPPRSYRHYCLNLEGHEVLAADRVERKIRKLANRAIDGTRLICILGPGGSGKSWHAIRLLDKLEKEASDFRGFFFWSSYYSDDYLTGLDRALAYLDPGGTIPGSRYERFRSCLEGERYFLVLDGFERLLREGSNPDEGDPYSKGGQSLFEALTSPASRSTVVLTSRLRPSALVDSKSVHIDRLERLEATDLEDFILFQSLPEHVPSLCSLLDGHAYGLLLAGTFLRYVASNAVLEQAIRELKLALASSPPDRRLGTMISRLIHRLDEHYGGLALGLLERLAFFMSPLTERTIRSCFHLACFAKHREVGSDAELDELVDDLLKCRLLFQVVDPRGTSTARIFTVHPTVRGYVFYRTRGSRMEVLPNFTLPGFTSGTAATDPGSRQSAKTIEELFGRLLDDAEAKCQEGASGELEAGELCRSAFSLLRSRMEAITTPRWASYEGYVRLGLRLLDLIRRLSPEVWTHEERHLLHQVEDPRAILFADELAWLYNDIGLSFCCEGSIRDTYAFWEQGYEINRIIEGDVEVGQYRVQSELHLGHTFIERGNLAAAEQYLEVTSRLNHVLGDEDYEGRIVGYQGLLAHLQGDQSRADKLYDRAVKTLRGAGGNPRAESFFLRLHGDLKRHSRDVQESAELLRESRAIAEVADHPDLVAFVTNSLGHLHRIQGFHEEAQQEYNTALLRARQFGIRRLEASVLSELSRFALDLGDYETARARAAEALSIANECGLGLRVTHTLLVLGLATLKSGLRDLGLAHVRIARKRARRQHYWLRLREAERHLQGEGVTPAFDWPEG